MTPTPFAFALLAGAPESHEFSLHTFVRKQNKVFFRHMNLILSHDPAPVAHDLVVTTAKGRIDVNAFDRAYIGYVEGTEKARIYLVYLLSYS